ncbi:MAG: type II CAAX endopeptidase family protein [Reinekea sp.]
MKVPMKTTIFSLLFFAPLPTIGVVFAAFLDVGVIGQAIWACSKIILFIGPVFYWRFVQKNKLVFPAVKKQGMLAGIISAILLALVIFLSYWLIARPNLNAEPLKDMMQSVGLTSPEKYVVLALYLTLINSLIEEYVFRWFFFKQLSQVMNPSSAVFFAAVLFTVHHTVVLAAYLPWYFNLLASLGVLSGGLIWSYLYYRYGHIWPSYISHIGADVGVFSVGYVLLFC